MRRLPAVLLLPVAMAAGLALADPPIAGPTPADRLRQFQRNQKLIGKLVKSGLELAGEEDPLRRADSCNRLAKELTQEIQRLVAGRARARADELGRHLEALLVRGVAGNLTLARTNLPPDSPRHPELRRLRDEALSVMLPLEEQLKRVPSQEQLQGVVQAVTKGRVEVERAVKGRTGTKAPAAGKKLKTEPR